MEKFLALLALLAISIIVAYAETPCQSSRRKALQSTGTRHGLTIIHKCDGEGNYEPLQCFENHVYCFCFDKDGDVLCGPSRNLKTCSCVIKQKELIKQGASYIPICSSKGDFVTIQADSENHWCVDKDTGETTKGPVPRSRSITCD